jgi:hypothetical protein
MTPRYSVIHMSKQHPKYRAETPHAIAHTAEDGITSIIATKATRNLAVVYAWHLNTTEGRHTLEDYS